MISNPNLHRVPELESQRARRSSTFDHPSRARIYDHLLRVPGDHFRSIARSLGLSLGTTGHHLGVLVDAGLLYARRFDGHRRFFPRGHESQRELNALFEKHWNYRDLRIRVQLAVQRLRDARLCTIAAALGISRQLAAYHLSCLVRDGRALRVGDRYVAQDGLLPARGTSDSLSRDNGERGGASARELRINDQVRFVHEAAPLLVADRPLTLP